MQSGLLKLTPVDFSSLQYIQSALALEIHRRQSASWWLI